MKTLVQPSSTKLAILLITFIYLLAFLYMLPLRDQAFGDDFAYIQSVEKTLETGKLYLTEWSAPTLIFQVVWGSLFAKLFGFAPKIMHLSTIVLLYFGVITFFLLLSGLRVEVAKALFFDYVISLFTKRYVIYAKEIKN